MADGNEDYYNDDFFDDMGRAPAEDQDEQQAQKVNGKIETLELRVAELQRELSAEKRGFEKELKSIKSSKDAENSQAELQKYKHMVAKLQDKLEMNSILSGSDPNYCPPALQEEFVKYCKRNKLFPELKERDMNVENCIMILNTKKKRAPSAGGTDCPPTPATPQGDQQLLERIRGLEDELRLALGAAEDIRALKAKLLQLIERTRTEKEHKLRSEAELAVCRKKVDMLSDHMEKLMIHLKHESAHKLRITEQLRNSEKEHSTLKEKYDILNRKSSAKDRLILELREGSKVLEDQLRLMDEKYLELRTKLDWARELGTRKVKKAEKVAADLRMKYALSGNSTLLDNVPLPDIFQGNASAVLDGGDSWISNSLAGSALPKGRNSSMLSASGGGHRLSKSLSSLKPSHVHVGDGGGSVSSGSTLSRKEPSMDVVLEKIRVQQGAKQEWNEEKLRALAISR